MLRSTKELLGYKIKALDDEVGTVKDFFFDDREWIVRYLVVDTGKWLPGRQVLISPKELGEPQWAEDALPVSLTKKQIEESPRIESDLPVSRQNEVELVKYYGWVPYWEPLGAPNSALPLFVHKEMAKMREKGEAEHEEWDPHLRSIKEINGYLIHASDDDKVGHVEDIIADTDTWNLRYMVVDTGKWLFGKKILVSPYWIEKIIETNREVWVDLPANQIKDGPEYDPSEPVNRAYELQLYDYYGRPAYWDLD